MSRIRGIETKPRLQKDVLQNQQGLKIGYSNAVRKKSEEESFDRDDAEKQQIDELLHKLPALDQIFEVHRKIGEGTFSSVYLGSLRRHCALPAADRRWFAIKHLVPTAHPARIEHELRCLQDIGGKHNVIGVDLCLRHLDTIVFIMPYIPHRKFSEYVGEMDWGELQRYMRALLEALRHVHSFGIIHRDVKPSNFLYDRDNKRYLLVDFGLAQRVCATPDEPAEPCAAPAPAPAPAPAHSNKRTRDQLDDHSSPGSKRMALDLTVESKRVNVNTVTPKKIMGSSKVQIPKAVALKVRRTEHVWRCAGRGGGRGGVRVRVRGRGRGVRGRRVRGAGGGAGAARGHAGLPPAGGAAQVAAAERCRRPVGRRRRARHRPAQQVPAVPRGGRRVCVGGANGAAGHGGRAARRDRPRPASGDVGAAAGAVPAQAERAPARRRPAPRAAARRAALRALPPRRRALPLPRRGRTGEQFRGGQLGSGVPGQRVRARRVAAGARARRAPLRRRRAATRLPRRPARAPAPAPARSPLTRATRPMPADKSNHLRKCNNLSGCVVYLFARTVEIVTSISHTKFKRRSAGPGRGNGSLKLSET